MRFIEKLLGLSIVMIFLFNTTTVSMVPRVNVVSASPSTLIYVDPSEVHDVPSGGWFVVKINVSEAPSTYAWNIYLSWDAGLLRLVKMWDPIWAQWTNVTEGSFLDRRYRTPWGWVKKYSTSLIHSPLDEANPKGEIMIQCSLVGAVPMANWASGNGWLCSLNFTVQAQGSTLLNLFKTRLADHLEGDPPLPAFTYYPNNDGFFYNVLPPIHDIRVTDVTVLNASVHLGEVAKINVTVLNEGTVTETSNLYVYADIDPTVIGDEKTIGTTSRSLNGAGNSEARSFTYEVTWNTGGCSKASYTISAYVPAVPGEVNTADNTRIDGTVQVKNMLCDVNGDDKVDIYDLRRLGKAYGSEFGVDPNYDPECDFNTDAKVDGSDLSIMVSNYGKSA